MIKAANLETTGGDHVTVQRNLNAHGNQKMEHYAQAGIIGYLRETAFVWEYRVVTMYGNSKILTDILNEYANDGWMHYLTDGSRGYFKKIIAEVEQPPVVVLKPAEIPSMKISDAARDRTGIPQMAGGRNSRNGNHRSR